MKKAFLLAAAILAATALVLTGCPASHNPKPQIETVSAPTADPNGGTVDSGTRVTLTCETPGASIRYTTNGVQPTIGTGAVYTETNKPLIAGESGAPVILKAIAYKAGMASSEVLVVNYTISVFTPPGTVATPTVVPAWEFLTNNTRVALSCMTPDAVIYYTLDNTDPATSPSREEYSDTNKPLITGAPRAAITLKAVAVKEEMANSALLTRVLRIIDASGLDAAIATLEAKLDLLEPPNGNGTIKISAANNGSDIPTDGEWVAQTTVTGMEQQITDANALKARLGSEAVTQNQIDTETENLTAAAAHFSPKSGIMLYTTALDAVIQAAETKMFGVRISNLGDGSEWTYVDFWVTQAMHDGLNEALIAARLLINSPVNIPETHAERQAAINAEAAPGSTLQTALAAYDPQHGTSPTNKNALNELIAQVEAALPLTVESASGSTVSELLYWVPIGAKTAMESALTIAEGFTGYGGADQSIVDNAKDALQGAYETFMAARNEGAKPDRAVITITWTGPADETFVIPSGVISGPGQMRWTILDNYEEYAWYVDGVHIPGEDGHELTLNISSFSPGRHNLTVKVTTAEGVTYSKSALWTIH